MFFILVATAIEAAGLVNQFAPLVLLGSNHHTSALPAAQLYALAYLPLGLASIDYSVHTVFFGFDIICMAYLVHRSTFLPKAIGVLLALDGLAYLVYSFADFLAPGFAAQLVPWIQLPALLGEGSLCVWLLVFGVDVERWKARECVNPDAVDAHRGTGMKAVFTILAHRGQAGARRRNQPTGRVPRQTRNRHTIEARRDSAPSGRSAVSCSCRSRSSLCW